MGFGELTPLAMIDSSCCGVRAGDNFILADMFFGVVVVQVISQVVSGVLRACGFAVRKKLGLRSVDKRTFRTGGANFFSTQIPKIVSPRAKDGRVPDFRRDVGVVTRTLGEKL